MPRIVDRSRKVGIALPAVIALIIGSAFGTVASVRAQESPAKPPAQPDPASLNRLIERIDRQEADLLKLRRGIAPAESPPKSGVRALLDVAHIGPYYSNRGQYRFLAVRVLFANPTENEVKIARTQISAEIDGENRIVKDIPPALKNL